MGKISSYKKLFSSKKFTMGKLIFQTSTGKCLGLVEGIAFQEYFLLLYIPVSLKSYFWRNFSTNEL